MPNISEVFIIDVSNILPHSTTKYCICVSAGSNRYFLINSEHREMYDDFEIKSSNYSFLKKDSYVGCSETIVLKEEFIIKNVGRLKYDDMRKILEKIQKSKHIAKPEREDMALELEEWLNDYPENQLKNIFQNR